MNRRRKHPATEVDQTVDDGFGSTWERCVRPDCDLQVVRPGKAQCSGDRDAFGCPRDMQEIVDRLYREVARLCSAGDALAAGVRTGRWDDALDGGDEARDRSLLEPCSTDVEEQR